MNTRNNSRIAGRDPNFSGHPEEPAPATLFGQEERFDERPAISPEPTPQEEPVATKGPDIPEQVVESPEAAKSAEKPFDMDDLIRAKQERIEPRPNLDPFDPARLRLSPDYGASIGVKRLLTNIPVRKPSKESFVRTHPDESYRLSTYVLELKEDQEIYLIAPELREELSAEATVSPRLLITTVNRAGIATLWPIRMPGPDGKLDNWSRSAMEAADIARTQWVRVTSSMSLGGYEVAVATATLAEPVWPEVSLGRVLEIAFRGRLINSMDHPVLRRLRGEI